MARRLARMESLEAVMDDDEAPQDNGRAGDGAAATAAAPATVRQASGKGGAAAAAAAVAVAGQGRDVELGGCRCGNQK